MEPKKTPTAAIVGLIGGVILVIGSFLSWATVSINVDAFAKAMSDALGVPVSGSDLASAGVSTSQSVGGFDADGKFTLALGIVALIGAAILLARKSATAGGILMLLGGLGGAGIALYDIVAKDNQIDKAIEDVGPALSQLGITGETFKSLFSVSWGIGIYACILGGIVALIAGIMAFTSKSSEPAMPATTGAPAATGFGVTSEPPASPPASPPAAPTSPSASPPAAPASPPASPAAPPASPAPAAPPEPPANEGGSATPPA